MATRRQEKFCQAIKRAVSQAISGGLNDPRIEGLITVTRVEMGGDLRNADVYISILGVDETSQRKTFTALNHARSRLQGYVADELESKFCPVIHLKADEQYKKTLETMRILDEVRKEQKADDGIQMTEQVDQ
jgi:ribosome-binding factor A